MGKESMTAEERVWTAVRLEEPDRVPVDILATGAFTKTVGGTVGDYYTNEDRAWAAIDKVWKHVGGWDLQIGGAVVSGVAWKLTLAESMGIKMKLPGIDLPDDYTEQAFEEEVLKLEDYEAICEMGWHKFMRQDYLFRITDLTQQDLVKAEELEALSFFKMIEKWQNRDVMSIIPPRYPLHPFFRLSVGRSMVKFIEDLYYRPEKVEKVLKVMTREAIGDWITHCKMLNQKICFIAEERAEAFFLPLHIFERFWWPYTVEIVDALWSEGIVTWFHLDQCWDKNIPYFKKLPRGSAILALDGSTDIFAAKEVLRGHLCLHGDVPPSLLSLGKPEDVEAYCKKLIVEVGAGGGFILSSGCEMPTEVKIENWQAMVQAPRKYRSRRK